MFPELPAALLSVLITMVTLAHRESPLRQVSVGTAMSDTIHHIAQSGAAVMTKANPAYAPILPSQAPSSLPSVYICLISPPALCLCEWVCGGVVVCTYVVAGGRHACMRECWCVCVCVCVRGWRAGVRVAGVSLYICL